MTQRSDSFEWVDVLLRRWQIIVALAGAIAWMTTLQIQVAAGNAENREMKTEIKSLNQINAEWPYLKEKVSGIDRKLDVLLTRSEVVR